MAIADFKRFLLPGALVAGGVTVGALLSPIGLAAADEDGGRTADESVDTDDESVDTTEEGRGHHRHHRGLRGRVKAFTADVVTDTLDMSVEELWEALAGGKSLAEVAVDQGVAAEDLEAALLTAAEDRIDEALAKGRIDQERADEMKARMADNIDDYMNRTFDGDRGRHDHWHWHRHRHGHGHWMGGEARQESAAELAGFLGLTTDDLRAAMAEGQTLAEVAEAQGVLEEDLVDFLLGQMRERLDAAVEEGTIDADLVDDILAEAEARIEERINGEPGVGHGRPGRGHGNGLGPGFGGRFGHKEDTSIGA
ncbi:MAG: hypothetical protein OER95_11520 [Acidimicrobiia bacterium]|nr:hypothetical protein [Acidimicrobiia bacterium]